MKILVISNSYPPAENPTAVAAFCVRNMVAALVARGAEVEVVAPRLDAAKSGSETLAQSGSEKGVHWYGWSGQRTTALINLRIRRPSGLLHALSLLRQGQRAVRRSAESFRPDVVLAAWTLPSGYFAWRLQATHGSPFAVWSLGSDIHTWAKKRFFGALTRMVLRAADLRYADGFALRDEVEELCGRPCGFLTTAAPPEPGPMAAGGAGDGREHFLFAGRWERVKGLDVLLEAWHLLAGEGRASAVRLHVVGHGEALGPRVEAAAREVPEDSLVVEGWVKRRELLRLYSACSCVVVPSRRESIPVVLTEAVHAGKPLIVTDVGDMGELVRRYRLGWVVPAESAEALRDAVSDFLDNGHDFDPGLLAEARALFDIGRSADDFLAAAQEVVRA